MIKGTILLASKQIKSVQTIKKITTIKKIYEQVRNYLNDDFIKCSEGNC